MVRPGKGSGVWTRVFLALVHQRLGHPDEAKYSPGRRTCARPQAEGCRGRLAE
jgi:hypothetical protein